MSIARVVDGETDADSIFMNQLVDAINGGEGIPSQIEAISGRTRLCLFDDFTDYANGSPAGEDLEVGDNPWEVAGGVPPVVTSGKLSSTGSGYLHTSLDTDSFYMIGGDISFGGAYGSTGATLSICRDEATLLEDFAHLIVGAESYTLTIRKDGGDFETILGSNWPARLPIDGTVMRFGLMIDGENAVVFGPDGYVDAVTDQRIPDALGLTPETAFWQATTGGATDAYLHRAWAFARTDTRYPVLADFANAAMAGVLNTRESSRYGISAGYGHPGTVYVGPNADGNPSIRMGARFITGELSVAMAITDTTFVTPIKYIPSGTVRIGIGDNAEDFTLSGFPTGTGPYTHTVTVAATKLHPIGTGFMASGMTTAQMFYDLGGDLWTLPTNIGTAGRFELGTNRDTGIIRGAAGVVAASSPGVNTVVFRTGSGNTASRPSAITVGAGAEYFDTTLGMPIWSTGAAWVKADGTAA
jgi:hypothetical protein